MKIVRHRLYRDNDTPYSLIPSQNLGGKLHHQYLVIHYTATGGIAAAIRRLTKKGTKASAHLVIGRDGTITQLVRFDRIAWHAGKSRWHGLHGLNSYSIGIEMDNAGALDRHGAKWRAWFGKLYEGHDVIEAAHQHGSRVRGWHIYPQKQIDAAVEVGRILADAYGLRDVIGHDDIAPGRKVDPGPAFPMVSYRAAVMGRRDDAIDLFQTMTHLNVREGPGTGFTKLAISPLAPGTRLRLDRREANWCLVEVVGKDGLPSDTGWVHSDYIIPV